MRVAAVLLACSVAAVSCGRAIAPPTPAPQAACGGAPAGARPAEAPPHLVIQRTSSDAYAQLAYSPSARLLASLAQDGRVRLWDAARGHLLQTLSIPELPHPTMLAWGEDDDDLVLAGRGPTDDAALRVRLSTNAVRSRAARARFGALERAPGAGPVRYYALDVDKDSGVHYDDRELCKGVRCAVVLLDADLHEIVRHDWPTGEVSVSATGRFFSTRDYDVGHDGSSRAMLWSTQSALDAAHDDEGDAGTPRDWEWSPPVPIPTYEYAPLDDGKVLWFERDGGKVVARVAAPKEAPASMPPLVLPAAWADVELRRPMLASDGETVLAQLVEERSDRPGRALVFAWSWRDGRMLWSRQLRSAYGDVAMSSDALHFAATGGGRTIIGDLRTGRELAQLGAATRVATDAVFVEGGDVAVASGSYGDARISRWSLHAGALVDRRGSGDFDLVARDGDLGFWAVRGEYADPCGERGAVPTVRAWGQPLARAAEGDPAPQCIAKEPDGDASGARGKVAVWRNALLEPARARTVRLEAPANAMLSGFAVSADDRIASGQIELPKDERRSYGGDRDEDVVRHVGLWQVTSGKLLRTVSELQAHVKTGLVVSGPFDPMAWVSLSSALSADASAVAVWRQAHLEIYDVATGKQTATLDLDAHVTAAVFGADARALLVGCADGSVRRIHDGAIERATSSDGGAIQTLRVDPRRALALSVSEDGAVRVWDAASVTLRGTLVDFDDDEWAITTPRGVYTGTAEVGERIGWVFERPLEYFGFEQFTAGYRDAALVRRRLAGEDVDAIARVTRPPSLEVVSAPRGAIDASKARVRVRASSAGRVDSVRAFVEGEPAASAQMCAPKGEVDLDVPLLPGINRVTVIAFDDRGFASNAATLDVASRARSASKPDVWVVAVGVTRYGHLPENSQLPAAVPDAESIARAFEALAGDGRPYGRAHVSLLTDDRATPDAIRRAVAGLTAMKRDDLAVVFFAGHGFKRSDADDMVFVTGGVEIDPARKVPRPDSLARSGVGWSDVSDALAKVPGRVVMLLDACHSGHLSQELVVPNEKLADVLTTEKRAGVVVFAAAKGRQESYEPGTARGFVLDARTRASVAQDDPEAHGFFTGALLRSLSDPMTDHDGDGAIQLSELVDEVTWRVTRASGGAQTPWIARRDLFGDFRVADAPRE